MGIRIRHDGPILRSLICFTNVFIIETFLIAEHLKEELGKRPESLFSNTLLVLHIYLAHYSLQETLTCIIPF